MDLSSILESAHERQVTREEALELLLQTEGRPDLAEQLYATARSVRKALTGDVFTLSGGIASVLPCKLKPLCLYCPYWREGDRRPLSVDEVVEAALGIQAAGLKSFHLSGGASLGDDGGELLAIVQAIWDAGVRGMDINVNCGASIGVDVLARLGELGVRSVGAVFEITNPEVFARVKPGDSLDDKMRFAWDIGAAGLKVSSGMMAGLGPAETRYEDYVTTLFDIAQFPHLSGMYISKFTPDPCIPMRDWPACSLDEAMRLMAVARLVMREHGVTPAAGWKNDERRFALLAGGGNSLFAYAANRRIGYWGGNPDGAEHEQGRIVYRDRRDEMRAMAEQMDCTLRE